MHVSRPGERKGLSDSYQLKTCGVPQSTYAGATRITTYVTSTSRRGGVMLSPPTRKYSLCGARVGHYAPPPRAHMLVERRTSPSPPLMDPNYGGRKRALSARLRRPVRLLRIGRSVVRSLSLSAASFCDMTCSQKATTASQDPPLPTILRKTVGSDRSRPSSAMRVRRGPSHAAHSSSTCRAACARRVSSPRGTRRSGGTSHPAASLCDTGTSQNSHGPLVPVSFGT